MYKVSLNDSNMCEEYFGYSVYTDEKYLKYNLTGKINYIIVWGIHMTIYYQDLLKYTYITCIGGWEILMW